MARLIVPLTGFCADSLNDKLHPRKCPAHRSTLFTSRHCYAEISVGGCARDRSPAPSRLTTGGMALRIFPFMPFVLAYLTSESSSGGSGPERSRRACVSFGFRW